MAAHARLSPSAADRWMICPGSVAVSEKYPNETSEFAAEGTVFHNLAEDCLLYDLDPREFIGQKRYVDGFEFTITEEMVDHLIPGLSRIAELGGDVYVENKVNLDEWIPGNFGTLDVGIIRTDVDGDEEIVIWDWKYGQGVSVRAEHNRQLRIYALGFWHNVARHVTDATTFRIAVYQPRIPEAGGEWIVTLDELLAFGEEVREAGKRTLATQPEFVPSAKGCYWCPAKNECLALAEFNLDLMGKTFDEFEDLVEKAEELSLPEIGVLRPEQMTYIWAHRQMITDWVEGIHTRIAEDYKHGRPTPGVKMVSGRRPPRRWIDEVEVAPLLEARLDDPYTRKLISPTQAEKNLGKEEYQNFAEYVDQGEPKAILVPEEDPRPAIPPVTDLFDD